MTALALALLLQALPSTSATCPLVAEPDALVSCPGWQPRTCRSRNARGELVRSGSVRREFDVKTGYPNGRHGHMRDHVRPLSRQPEDQCNGCDVGWNLVWLPEATWRDKSRWERTLCGASR